MNHVKAIIWDMDGVKYTLTREFNLRYVHATARAAATMIPGMEFDRALALTLQSQQEQNSARKVFIDSYKLDPMQLSLNTECELDITDLSPSPGFVRKLHETDTDHILLTQGNPVWTERILVQLGLNEFYDDKRRITHADYLHCTKGNSRYPFELALTRMECSAENALMIEDTEPNLHHPKDMGMTTVLVDPFGHHKKSSAVDYVFENAESFLDYFNAQRKRGLGVN